MLRNPYVWAAVAVGVSVVLAPVFCYEFDVFKCWVPWMGATGGVRPWRVYDGTTRYPCNYPPGLAYLWTATAAVRRLFPILRHRWLTLELVKLPNILAWAAGVPVCHLGLRRAWGEGRARAAAVAYAVCVPLLFDAAVWGQYDAILGLAMVGVVVASIAGRPVLAGALGGLAVGIKLQAVVLVPTAGVYLVRRFGWRSTGLAVAAAAGVLAVLAGPIVVAGRGRQMRAAYTGAVGFYPELTINAANVWQPVRAWDVYVRGIAVPADTGGPRAIGLGMLAIYTAGLVGVLWRRADGVTFARAAGLTAFGFFMLPTQQHERYLVPAAVLLAVPAGWSAGDRWVYGLVSASAAAQLAIQQYREAHPASPAGVWDAVLVGLTVANVGLLAWATWRYVRPGDAGAQLPV